MSALVRFVGGRASTMLSIFATITRPRALTGSPVNGDTSRAETASCRRKTGRCTTGTGSRSCLTGTARSRATGRPPDTSSTSSTLSPAATTAIPAAASVIVRRRCMLRRPVPSCTTGRRRCLTGTARCDATGRPRDTEQHGQPGSDHGYPRGGERDLPAALHAPAPLPSSAILHQRPYSMTCTPSRKVRFSMLAPHRPSRPRGPAGAGNPRRFPVSHEAGSSPGPQNDPYAPAAGAAMPRRRTVPSGGSFAHRPRRPHVL